MEEFARKDDRYSERADGSLRPRPRAQPASPALTQPVWKSAPFGLHEAPPRTPPAAQRPARRPSPPRADVSHARECLIAQPSTIITVGGSGGRNTTSLDEGGAVVSVTPRREVCPPHFRTNAPLEKLLAAKRSASVSTPSPLRTASKQRSLAGTSPASSAGWSPQPSRTSSASPRRSATPRRREPQDPASRALAAIPILRGLTPKERDDLARRLDSRSYLRGESVIVEAEKGDSLYIVSTGEAEAEVKGVGVVRQYSAGQWFGELALISGAPRKATVTAVTECTMLVLQRDDFERLIGKLGEKMEALRRRFDSASYSFGRKDVSKLFHHYDRDNTGFLDLGQFRAACRKDGHVKVGDVGEREIRCLYHLIDLDGDGQIGEADWAAFLGAVDPRYVRQRITELEQRRQDLDTQCRAVLQHGTPEACAKAKAFLVEMQVAEAEMAQLQGDVSKMHRTDQKRIYNYQFAVQQLHACEVQRDSLQAQANDPSAAVSLEMVEKLSTVTALIDENRQKVANASGELELIMTIAPQKIAAAKLCSKLPDGRVVFSEPVDSSPADEASAALSPVRRRKGFLADVPLFKGLTASERGSLARALSSEEYGAGHPIIKQGEVGESMYIIESGTAAVQIEGIGRVATLEAGSVFGELALVSGEPRQATIITSSPTTVLVLERADFERIVGKIGDFVRILRQRFQAASYAYGRRDYHKLFNHFDRLNRGYLDPEQFRAAVRKDGRMTQAVISEKELRTLYCVVDVDQDDRISEEDFIAFLGVTNPATHEKEMAQHRKNVEELHAYVQQLTKDATQTMQEGNEDAGQKTRALLKQKRLTEDKLEFEKAEMARKEKENADGLRSYNILKGKIAQLNKRKQELEQLVTECPTDELAQEHTEVTQKIKKYTALMAVTATNEYKSTTDEESDSNHQATQTVVNALKVLKSIPILRGLTPKERDDLARRLDSRSYLRGESVIVEAEKGDSLYIVSTGEAEAEVKGVGVVRQYSAGQWFGELALISGAPRKATVTAVTECTMLVLQRDDFERLIGKLGEKMEALRRRFDSASYSFGRKDVSKLFHHYDRDNTGFLDLGQFRAACRKDGHVKVGDVGEREIRCLYHLIDLDGDGQIGEADWAAFLQYDLPAHPIAAPVGVAEVEAVAAHQPEQSATMQLAPQPEVKERRLGANTGHDGDPDLDLVAVKVLRCRGLIGADRSGKSDPYVSLFLDDLQEQKTKTKKSTLEPVFNEAFHTFRLTTASSNLRVLVKDHDHGGSDDTIGEVVIDVSEYVKSRRWPLGPQVYTLGDPYDRLKKSEKKLVQKRISAGNAQPYGTVEIEFSSSNPAGDDDMGTPAPVPVPEPEPEPAPEPDEAQCEAAVGADCVVVDLREHSTSQLKLELSPWYPDQVPAVMKRSEGVIGSEVVLGRGRAGISDTDAKLPRQNMRLFCEASAQHPEGLVWKVENTKDGRMGEVERDGKTIPLPPPGEQLHLCNNDILHQRRRSSGKPTHPIHVRLTFNGKVISAPSGPVADTRSQDQPVQPVQQPKQLQPPKAVAVTVFGCQGLVGAENAGRTSNPYVKLSLDGVQKQQTRPQYRTLSPSFQGEEFSFRLKEDSQTIRMKVYSHSRTTKSFLGEARIDVGDFIASGRRPQPGLQTLQLGDPASQMAKSERKHIDKRWAEHAQQQPFGTIQVELRCVEHDASVAGPPPISQLHREQEQGWSSGLDSSIDSSLYESADDAEVAR